MSVVKPVREIVEPDEALWRLSHELPSQAIGPCTRCATSTMGCSAIFAPSKAQPPAAAPGVSCLVQPFLRSFSVLPWFLSQPGSSNTSAILAFSDADIRASRAQQRQRTVGFGCSIAASVPGWESLGNQGLAAP